MSTLIKLCGLYYIDIFVSFLFRYDHVKTRPSLDLDSTKNKHEGDKWGSQRLPLTLNTQDVPSNMVTLKKGGLEESLALAAQVQEKELLEKKWTQAKEFVPGERFHGAGKNTINDVRPVQRSHSLIIGSIWKRDLFLLLLFFCLHLFMSAFLSMGYKAHLLILEPTFFKEL